MQKMTSACAHKLIRSLQNELSYWRQQEEERSTYNALNDEEPVIPEYNYEEVSKHIEEINNKIAAVRHAINLSNVTAQIKVGDEEMSVDTILIKMAQLSGRKARLDKMRRRIPKSRSSGCYDFGGSSAPEYTYINYDLDMVKRDYEKVCEVITKMQIALDYYNQTFQFDVDI